jgi:hypothetical protein
MKRELEKLPGILEDNQYKIHPHVIFQLPKNYPFSPPILSIYSKDHITCLAKLFHHYRPFIKKYNVPIDCICCFSITCMWSPCHTCKHVYDEYVTYCTQLRQVIAAHYFIKGSSFDDLVNSHIISYLW